MKPIVNYQNKDLYLNIGEYPNGRIGILLNDENGELWDDLTVNLPNKKLEKDYIFINPRIDNDLLDKLCETGVFLNLYRIEDYDYRVVIVNMDALKKYRNDYQIEMWVTEEDRNQGFVNIYDKHYDNLNDALKKARDLYGDDELASIMITNNGESIYCRDKETFETFYLNDDKFSKVPKEILDEYISNYTIHKELPIKEDKIYCENDDTSFIAVDNSSGECYVEEFQNEKQVHEWLLGKEREEIDKEIIEEVTL